MSAWMPLTEITLISVDVQELDASQKDYLSEQMSESIEFCVRDFDSQYITIAISQIDVITDRLLSRNRRKWIATILGIWCSQRPDLFSLETDRDWWWSRVHI